MSTEQQKIVAALAMLLGACSSTVSPIEVGPDCPELPERGPRQWASDPDPRLIDDFEDAEAALPRIGGRDGSWIVGSDQTFQLLRAESSVTCAARGHRAGHFVGGAFRDWGANWTAVMHPDANSRAVPFNASAYSGISFWGAVAQGNPSPFVVPVGVTTIDVAWNGGICATCMDYYRRVVTLTRDWQRIVIRFSELEQAGTGDPLVALRKEQLVGFIIWPDQPFDIWLDDVRFEQ